MTAAQQPLHASVSFIIAAMVAFGGAGGLHATEQGYALTPGYLEGRWCYAYIAFGSQREEVGTEYVFHPDGTLEYQVGSRSDKMGSGSYSIEDGQIEILPTLVMFDLMIGDVDADTFMLDAMGGKHVFVRGECRG